MAWSLDGTYFENCSCEVPCPCTASFSLGADYDRCEALLAFHVDRGEVDGVDVAGLSAALVIDSPKVMSDGGWRVALIVDAAASDEQAEKLGAVFSGQLGGPPGALGPLLGEVLGVESLPIEYSDDGLRHRFKAGDDVEMDVEDVVPFGKEDGEPVQLAGVFHPANSTLTIAKAGKGRVKLLGLEWSNDGKSGFSAPFSWSA
jgi:hypothetical protein